MKTELQKFRELVGNKIFSVEFIKKDGSLREMVCRLGVTKHLKGGSLGYHAEDYNYLIVFDMTKKEYRTLNVSTLRKLKFEGNTYTV